MLSVSCFSSQLIDSDVVRCVPLTAGAYLSRCCLISALHSYCQRWSKYTWKCIFGVLNKTCVRTWTPKLPQNSKSQTFVLDGNTFNYQSKFEREVFVTCNEHVEGIVQPWQKLSFSDCSLIVWVMRKLKCMPKGAQRKLMLLDIVYSLNAQ